MSRSTFAAVAIALAATGAAQGQTVYVAFGDSITAGYHDSETPPGYPPRLQTLLNARGVPVTVINAGLNGESTAEGLTRLPTVLGGANSVLIMEGTNDINEKVSLETITTNLSLMATTAQQVSVTPVHATAIPRLPSANTDPDNAITGQLAAMVRDLAWQNNRKLVDPFEEFLYLTPNAIPDDYYGDGDNLHPNAAGYDLLAETFADELSGVDSIPPVPGLISPPNQSQNVSPNAGITVVLYDFLTGIDLTSVQLSVVDQQVTPQMTGDSRKLTLSYTPPQPLDGVVNVHVHAQDLANPPNVLDRDLTTFVIAGTTFLPGDLNLDGRVDGKDLVILALAFGAHRYNTNYNQIADINGDGIVDGLDLAILAANFGKRSF